MAHEFWREVKGGILDHFHLANGSHPFLYQIWLNFCGLIFNSPAQLCITALSLAIEPNSNKKNKAKSS
jgi:hypothetical protein